jgi:hypothetical protein
LESPNPGTYLVQIAGMSGDRVIVQETAGMVVPYSSEYRSAQANPGLLNELATTTNGRLINDPAAVFDRLNQVFSAQEIALPLLWLALILLPLDIALRRLMIRRSDFSALGTLRVRKSVSVAPDPVLSRLRAARDQARRQMVPERVQLPLEETPPTQPSAPPPPPTSVQPEDALTRLRAAKERARKRITGEGDQ